MTAFGGHRVDTGAGRKVSAMPISAATKYAAQINRPIAAGRTSSALVWPREVGSPGLETASDMRAGVSAGQGTAPERREASIRGCGSKYQIRRTAGQGNLISRIRDLRAHALRSLTP